MVSREYIGVALLAGVVGLPGAFFTIALPAQMRDGGASLIEIGLVYIVWLPSALKWLWAPAMERLAMPARVRSRAVALVSVLLGVCFLGVAPLAEQMAIVPLVAMAALSASLALSLQLIYASWTMRALDENQRGRANGFAASGMVLGGIIGGGLLPWAADMLGWWPVVLLTSLMMLIAGLAGRFLKDRDTLQVVETASMFQGVWVLRRAHVVVCLLLIAVSSGGDVILPARLVDAGISPEKAGLLLGSLAMVLIVPAALLSGWLISRLGIGVCFLTCAILKGGVLLALALSASSSGAHISVLSVVDFVLAGALTVLTWQFYMRYAQGAVPMASYAVLTSLDALVRFLSALGAGGIADRLGYPWLFSISAVAILGAGVAVASVIGMQRVTLTRTDAGPSDTTRDPERLRGLFDQNDRDRMQLEKNP